MRFLALGTTLILVGTLACQNQPPRAPDASGDGPPTAGTPAFPTAALNARADSLDALNPEAEAENAAARQDFRFAAVCGYACVPPGIDVATLELTPEDLRIIEGTSDAVTSDAVARLNESARRYALRYNQAMLKHRSP